MTRKTAPAAPAKKAAVKKSPAAKVATPATPTAAPPSPAAPEPTGKLAALITLMQRHGGATLGELQDATGWRAHSVRGALAGALKKKHGLTILSTKTEGVRRYSVPSASAGQ